MWVGHGDGRGGIVTVLKQDTRDTRGAPSLPWWGMVLSSQASFQDFVSLRPLYSAGGKVFRHED